MIEQLTFDSLRKAPVGNPDLIILGKDPDDPQQWILKCSDCGNTRSVSYHSKRHAVRQGTSFCHACATRRARLCARKDLPVSDDCIVVNPLAKRGINSIGVALVKCPDCGKEFFKTRARVLRDKRTVCKACANRRRTSRFIHTTDECIVVKQFVPSRLRSQPAALVRCPDCGKEFVKFRNSIMMYHHTRCQDCSFRARFGELYQENSYGKDWNQIRIHVRGRDNHSCQWPGCNETTATLGRAVCVHHIKPFKWFEKSSEANKHENLVCLCPSHHGTAETQLDESIPMLTAIVKELIAKL